MVCFRFPDRPYLKPQTQNFLITDFGQEIVNFHFSPVWKNFYSKFVVTKTLVAVFLWKYKSVLLKRFILKWMDVSMLVDPINALIAGIIQRQI